MESTKSLRPAIPSTAKTIKKIAEKEHKLKECEGRILALRDEVKSTAISLKEQKETAKSRRLHESQNFAHNAHMDMDRRLRPSDRGNDIRQYGKMDADIWKYDTLRDWFNKYASPPPVENWSAIESGYTIRIDRST